MIGVGAGADLREPHVLMVAWDKPASAPETWCAGRLLANRTSDVG
jgi:hypothetical protein